ncbi:MAG TPA: hypothetical protein VKC66_24575 [Xanthobacteraceae bacterium]|nr:hypothetical protein [Xanthobacteraceae bacterium]
MAGHHLLVGMQFFKFRLPITLRARKVQLRRISKVQCVVDQGAGKPAGAPAIVLQRKLPGFAASPAGGSRALWRNRPNRTPWARDTA